MKVYVLLKTSGERYDGEVTDVVAVYGCRAEAIREVRKTFPKAKAKESYWVVESGYYGTIYESLNLVTRTVKN
jgi:hypothetical protein